MAPFEVGMKIYDNDWFLKFGLSYQAAARMLKDWGVTFVLSQNKYLPMPDSAVDSEVTPDDIERYTQLDDRKFRDALADEGIAYWATVCTFFDPLSIKENPSLCPVGSDGKPMEKIDWYIGIAPSMEGYVRQKAETIAEAVRELEPVGVFLSFTRWPGFWELWTPGYLRGDFPEYSYDPITLGQFRRETGVVVPDGDPKSAAFWIEENARENWTSWKCARVVEVIRQIKEASNQVKPDTQIMLNTIPFGTEFDGAQEKVFGQKLETLSEVVDAFEVMTYHQILKRPTSWIPQIGQEVKSRTGKKTFCTLQAVPLYLEGIHSRENRATTIDDTEFAQAVLGVETAGLDGVVVFVWSDLLKMVMEEGNLQRIDAIRKAIRQRDLRGD
jgi:hypothetical protein